MRNSRKGTMVMRWGAAGLILLGLILGGSSFATAAMDYDLATSGSRAIVSDVQLRVTRQLFRDKFQRNGRFVTRHGEIRWCRGWFESGETVVYDAAHPSRCRPEWATGWFDHDEMFWFIVGMVLVLLGGLALAFERLTLGEREIEALLAGQLPDPGPGRTAPREPVRYVIDESSERAGDDGRWR